MDLSKVTEAIEGALASTVLEKKMTGEEFVAYAGEQLALAKGEEDAAARARLTALKEQAEVVSKFTFKDGELPTVKFFKAPEQTRPTLGAEQAPSHQQLGGPGMGWTAKAASLGQLLEQFLGSGTATPATPGQVAEAPSAAPATPAAKESTERFWPEDLALDIDAE